MERSIAIIGGGYSGVLLALHLLEDPGGPSRISLIERSAGFGRGLAYATANPRHLLNVRVANMSAWPERPDHLRAWLDENQDGRPDGSAFISRGVYGRYLAAQLQAAVARADGPQRLLLEYDEVVGVERRPRGYRLTLGMGHQLDADAVVLALGNQPPSGPAVDGLEALPPDRYARDPWAPAALDDLDPNGRVVLLGSGLTMVDVALTLEGAGHAGPILALSRRGLAPRRHDGAMIVSSGTRAPQIQPLSRRLGAVRRRSAQIGWRGAVDELRPVTQAIWRAAGEAERARFLRHLQPWWDVHRHRMAPAVAEWFEAQQRSGRLTLAAARMVAAERAADGVQVICRARGSRSLDRYAAVRIINCTGSSRDLTRTSNPLLKDLLARGLIRPDPLRLGLDVDDRCRIIGENGEPRDDLFAVGSLTRGAFWEVVAVPDIRNQVAQLAGRLRYARSLKAEGV